MLRCLKRETAFLSELSSFNSFSGFYFHDEPIAGIWTGDHQSCNGTATLWNSTTLPSLWVFCFCDAETLEQTTWALLSQVAKKKNRPINRCSTINSLNKTAATRVHLKQDLERWHAHARTNSLQNTRTLSPTDPHTHWHKQRARNTPTRTLTHTDRTRNTHMHIDTHSESRRHTHTHIDTHSESKKRPLRAAFVHSTQNFFSKPNNPTAKNFFKFRF